MQACPARSEWKVWQRAILLLSSGNVLGNSALQTPLGTWISDPHRSYKWLYSPSTNSVYHKVRCGWKKYTKSSRCRTSSDRRHYKLVTGWADIPSDAQPTTIAKGPLAQQIWMEGGREKFSTPSASTAMHWFQHAAESRSLEVWGLLRHTRFYVPEDILYQSLCRGNWRMVSDGSYHPDFNIGTAAVVLEDTDGTTLLSTYLKTPGAGDDINAFRSELAGAYAACLIIDIIATHFKCEAVPVTLGCDNETTVFTALQSSYYSPIMVKHFDLIWEIQSIIFKLPISLNAVHVKGYQSEEECRKSHLARINARADQLAKLYLSQCIDDPSIQVSQFLGGKHWSLVLDGKKVTKCIDDNISMHIHGRALKKHLAIRNRWDESAVNSVDWDTMSRVSKHNTHSETIWRMKMASGFVPVGTRMTLVKKWESDICPRCKLCPETIEHMLVCSFHGAATSRCKNIQLLAQ